MRRVITIGAATIDCLMKSSALKVMKSHEVAGGVAMCEVLGGKMEAEDGVLTTGGGGTNVAVGLSRLGHAVKIITRIGNDIVSKIIVDQLKNEGVNLEMLQKGEGKTGLSAILVANSGARSIVTYRGESGLIDSNQVNWRDVEKADWVQISSLGGNMEFLEDLVAFAVEKKVRIGINPGKGELGSKERLINLLPKFDFVNMNRMEASTLWNIDFENEKKIAQEFISCGCKLVAITDGKRGASILDGNKLIKMVAFPGKSIDDTGAGDAFVSGAVSGILDDRTADEILKIGLANGGSVVTRLGAKEGLLYADIIEKYLKKQLKTVEMDL